MAAQPQLPCRSYCGVARPSRASAGSENKKFGPELVIRVRKAATSPPPRVAEVVRDVGSTRRGRCSTACSAACAYVRTDIPSAVSPKHKPLVWLSGEVKSPPFSAVARVEAGYLLRLLQGGQSLSMPQSRPMPVIGPQCHEVRIQDERRIWRIVYRVDADAVVIADVFAKTTQNTPATVIKNSQRRLRAYDDAAKG